MRRSIVLSLVVLAVLVPVVSPALATGGEPQPAQQEASQNFTVEELRTDGTHYEKPSARIANDHIWWVVHWPADQPWSEPGEDQQWSYLKPGATVQRNAVYLRTIRTEEAAETKTVHLVYWTQGERTVTQGNTTTTEPVARNVTHVTKEVQFAKGWPSKKIALRQHEETVRVTMWIEDAPSEARWTFKHRSVATTQSANIDSQGDYLLRAFTQFVLPTIVGLFIVGMFVKQAIDKAGRGPGYGYGPWIVGLGLGAGGVLLTTYSSTASLLVDLPWIMAALTVGVAGIVMLETYTANVREAAFFQPKVSDATSPTGEDARDILHGDWSTETVIKKPDGTTLLARTGLLAFLARWAGGGAVLEGAEKLDTEIHLDGGEVDELYIIDPDAEEPVQYDPEGWTLNLPDPEEEGWPSVLTTFGVLGGATYALAQVTNPAIAVGLAVVAGGWMWLEPTKTSALVNGASVHMREAWASMIFLAEESDKARTLQENEEMRVEDQARVWSQANEIISSGVAQMGDEMEEMWGTEPPEAGEVEAPATEPSSTEVEADD